MIVVIIVAILAAAAVPIYRSMVSKSYESEIVSGLGAFRTAQSAYRTEHGNYADQAGLEGGGLIAASDFEDMGYVQYGDYSIPSSADDTYTIEWSRPSGGTRDIGDYDFATVTMDQGGTIARS